MPKGCILTACSRTLNESRWKAGEWDASSAKLELRIQVSEMGAVGKVTICGQERIAREKAWLTQMEHEISLMPVRRSCQ